MFGCDKRQIIYLVDSSETHGQERKGQGPVGSVFALSQCMWCLAVVLSTRPWVPEPSGAILRPVGGTCINEAVLRQPW